MHRVTDVMGDGLAKTTNTRRRKKKNHKILDRVI